jgi:hypothetical protein
MVTLGAVLLALTAAYFGGVLAFGKNKKQPKHTYSDSVSFSRAMRLFADDKDAKTVSSV